MAKRKTYLDSCVLISAFRGNNSISESVWRVIDDPERDFVISDFLRLELLPKPTYTKNDGEVAFMKEFFNAASEEVKSSEEHVKKALELACKHGLSAVDALHATAAIESNVDDFITAEKQSKPFFNIDGLNAVSIYKT